MEFFNNCTTIEEVKKLYKTLALANHPDRGGNTATMQKINSEYSYICAKILSGDQYSAEDRNTSILETEAYMNAVNKVAGLEGIVIELVGTWIWVRGNTKPYSKILKDENGGKFVWAKKKDDYSAWFFRTSEHKFRKFGPAIPLDEIKNKYGYETINNTYKGKNSLHAHS
ncbi:MAG: hypothetical protein WKF91_15550 [Segetibacter sp.]